MRARLAVVVSGIVFAFGVATSSFAQQPTIVGELLEKGAKKLEREELSKLLSGAQVRGPSMNNPNWTFDAVFKSDGTQEGTSTTGVGRAVQFHGKWSVSEQGELCSATRISAGEGSSFSQACTTYYVLGGTYYAAQKNERSAPVFLREIKR